jgi:hypothetical protein
MTPSSREGYDGINRVQFLSLSGCIVADRRTASRTRKRATANSEIGFAVASDFVALAGIWQILLLVADPSVAETHHRRCDLRFVPVAG